MESPLKYQHRCVSIFKVQKLETSWLCTGLNRGTCGHNITSTLPTREIDCCYNYVTTFYRSKDNFTFKCHRSVVTAAGQTQNIYAVRRKGREGRRERERGGGGGGERERRRKEWTEGGAKKPHILSR